MGGSHSEFATPWRNVEWGNTSVELEKLKSFSPKSGNTKHLRVLLCGPAGSGKSSFINSVDSICQKRIKVPADTNSCGQGPVDRPAFTPDYKTYLIQKEKPGQHYPFVLSDTMGFKATGGVCVDDIKLAMKGHVKEGYKFNPCSAVDVSNDFYEEKPTSNDKAHVLVCVVAINTNEATNEEMFKKMTEVRLAARDLGIPQMAILTKIDEQWLVQQDLQKVYKSTHVKSVMEMLSATLGIPMNCIFPVKNYHEEVDLNDDVDMLILSALGKIVALANDRLNAACFEATNQMPMPKRPDSVL